MDRYGYLDPKLLIGPRLLSRILKTSPNPMSTRVCSNLKTPCLKAQKIPETDELGLLDAMDMLDIYGPPQVCWFVQSFRVGGCPQLNRLRAVLLKRG